MKTYNVIIQPVKEFFIYGFICKTENQDDAIAQARVSFPDCHVFSVGEPDYHWGLNQPAMDLQNDTPPNH